MLLQELRQEKDLSLRQLEKYSGVPNASIWMIENKQKGCGQAIASKLADGLDLARNARVRFLDAANTTVRRRSQRYPAALADALFAELRGAGIKEENVVRIEREAGGRAAKYDLVLELCDGSIYAVELKTTKLK